MFWKVIKNNEKRNQKAFTFTELLISMTIIVLLSSLLLAEYQRGEYSRNLNDAAQRLAQDIRRVENMSFSGEKYEGTLSQGGYGVYFNRNSPLYYEIFADRNNNERFDQTDTELIERVEFPEQIQLNVGISENPMAEPGASDGATEAWVIFPLFTSNAKINTLDPSSSGNLKLEVKICWLPKCQENTRIITVTNKGMVEIE